MQVINKFIEKDGILAACAGQQGALEFSFSSSTVAPDREKWKGMFAQLISVLNAAPESDEVKAITGELSLVFRRSGDTYVGVVVIKGHPVVKSVQRMVRAGFRKLGSPVLSPRDARAARERREDAALPLRILPPVVTDEDDDLGPRF